MRTSLLSKLTALACAVALLSAPAHAVLLQLDTSSTPRAFFSADWSVDINTYNQIVSNSSTPNSIFETYSFDTGGVTGGVDADLTVGTTNELTLDITSLNQINTSGNSGMVSFSPMSTWTVEIVAETGETNGTPVNIDWYAFLTGEVDPDALADWTITIDGTDVFQETQELTGPGSSLIFNRAEGDTLSTYSIGDTFTLDFEFNASTTDVATAEYTSGSTFSLSATVVPEPSTGGLLALGAAGLAMLRRARVG